MKDISKNLYKKLLCLNGEHLDEADQEYMRLYWSYYQEEQIERHIKLVRGKVREQERREKRICNFLTSQNYERTS